MRYAEDLVHIREGLRIAAQALDPFTPGAIESQLKDGGDPVTAADTAVDNALREFLLRPGEGWLSEETVDDAARLDCSRVWVVDPIDGTREFIAGIPEWGVSIGLVVDGQPVAGGILNPAAGHEIVGAVGHGVTLNGEPVADLGPPRVDGALVLASRSEMKRGEWEPFFKTPISVRNMGSVAYKLGLVGAGFAEATWTLVPKHEWDVAGGAALVCAAGGSVCLRDGTPYRFNQAHPKLPNFVAVRAGLGDALIALIAETA